MKSKRRNGNVSDLKRASLKIIDCNCGNQMMASEDAESGTCWVCVQKSVEIPVSLKEKEESGKIVRPRGWKFMKVYVDGDGNVFHKGEEQPDLKGTLLPSVIEKKKKLSVFERNKKEIEKEEKLAKKYERKKNGNRR